jgi:hypothetical protein
VLKAAVSPPQRHPGYIAGATYVLPETMGAAAAVSAVDVIYLWMWIPAARVTPATIGTRIATGGAGSSMKVGIWRNNPATMRPTGTPLASNNTGGATTSTNTTVLLAVSGFTAVVGTPVWVGAKFTGTLPTTLQPVAYGQGAQWWGGAIGNNAAGSAQGLSAPDTYSNDIAATDLTSASFTVVTGSVGVPLFMIGT